MFEERINKMNVNDNSSPNHSPSFKQKRKSDSKKGGSTKTQKKHNSNDTSSLQTNGLFDKCLRWISCRQKKNNDDEQG